MSPVELNQYFFDMRKWLFKFLAVVLLLEKNQYDFCSLLKVVPKAASNFFQAFFYSH